ncbi:hypothetical protein JL193_04290 [Polaribacter batillariae]|uniref:DUF4890 domain-containing protein n=1 Tax=Polaribacter batillariae TaxID=2808900 RepID=A0ABX7SWE6_9FLAO|nr:hypothetical protein [Polaribacter batillariae]QTD38516.1 hypothetical protein JL193_04290 [Polaribacter batillariae]
MKKITFLFVLFLGLSFTTFSQSKKEVLRVKTKATEITNKLNDRIVKGNANVALSEEQKVEIIKIHTERINALKKLGKDASKEEKDKLNKSYYKKIFSEILTKEQIKAQRKKSRKK